MDLPKRRESDESAETLCRFGEGVKPCERGCYERGGKRRDGVILFHRGAAVLLRVIFSGTWLSFPGDRNRKLQGRRG